jgi:acetyl-CoA carboxylase biotin carboxyl carrier protein
VEVGRHVDEGDALCILEAMKLMNEVTSEVSGTVRAIFVENSAAVEYGQPLFAIELDQG